MDNVLFCLDGVGWSHIVAGDITALSSCQGASEPPIPFSVRERERQRDEEGVRVNHEQN